MQFLDTLENRTKTLRTMSDVTGLRVNLFLFVCGGVGRGQDGSSTARREAKSNEEKKEGN